MARKYNVVAFLKRSERLSHLFNTLLEYLNGLKPLTADRPCIPYLSNHLYELSSIESKYVDLEEKEFRNGTNVI